MITIFDLWYDHSVDCAQTEKRRCPSEQNVHGEGVGVHWWSGWPGAHCMKCGDEDKDEVCLAIGCSCKCHAEFWKAYEDALDKKMRELEEDPLAFDFTEHEK